MSMREPESATVIVQLNPESSLGISEDNRLRYYSHNRDGNRSLGPATKRNIRALIEALERLEKHAF